MNKAQITQQIIKYLELNLSDDGLGFFIQVTKSFNSDDALFFDFVKAYLTIQNGNTILDENELYSAFVLYFDKYFEIQGEKKFLKQFARYAKYYLMLKMEYVDDEEFQRVISVINSYEADDVYPFLMEVLDDFENKRLENDALIEMLKIVEELVFKRHQNGDKSSLATIGSDINKMLYQVPKDVRSVG